MNNHPTEEPEHQNRGWKCLEIVQRRWPWLAERLLAAPTPRDAALLADLPAQPIRIDGVQLSGGYDPLAEAALQAMLVKRGASEATVYGLGQAWLPMTLLTRSELEHLRICPLSAAVAKVVLENHPTPDWLEDPRVEFVDPLLEGELRLPFCVTPAELVLADADGARVRDWITLELATPFLRRRRAAQSEGIVERIEGNRTHIEGDGDVETLEEHWAGRRVHVIAAGPSLEESLDQLRRRPFGEPVIACDGALRSLVEGGVVPDVVLALDMDREALLGLLDVEPSIMSKVTLVYDPCAHADAIGRWEGCRLVTYGTHEAYASIMETHPRTRLWSAGSVLHAAVDLACLGGAAEVVLHGADFATPGGKSHADGFAWQKQLADRGPNTAWVEGQEGQRLESLPNLVGYLRELERYIARQPGVRFINASRGARIRGTKKPKVAA